ncbi:hypothetical protein F4823DRAFT_636216 [Ustulina deusta]|nr:hypothetical protein F4823DRAFT_636216 [Ustulina deusta]
MGSIDPDHGPGDSIPPVRPIGSIHGLHMLSPFGRRPRQSWSRAIIAMGCTLWPSRGTDRLRRRCDPSFRLRSTHGQILATIAIILTPGNVPGGHTIPPGGNTGASLINAIQCLTGVQHATSDEAGFAVFEFKRIKVDESSWFNFLKRDKWWDLEGRDDKLGVRWSVDDPKVWAEFSPCLELANRMLNALVDHEHDWVVSTTGATCVMIHLPPMLAFSCHEM